MTKDEALKMAEDCGADIKQHPMVSGMHIITITDYELISFVEALEQPAQEPVAWMKPFEMKFIKEMKQRGAKEWTTWLKAYCSPDDIALYTHPAPSWQGLSDDEIREIDDVTLGAEYFEEQATEFARAIEQASRIKNGQAN